MTSSKQFQEIKSGSVEWFGHIPPHWQIKKISELFEERNEKVSDKDFEPLSVTKMGILPQLENVAKTDNNDNRKKVLKNDFVINSRSDRKGSCGVSNLDGSVSLICTVVKPRHDRVFMDYFHYLFRNSIFSEEFYRWGRGIVNDLWSTRWDEFKRILVPFPNFEEQKSIAHFLNDKTNGIEEIVLNKQNQIESLQRYRLSLITETVTRGLNPHVKMKHSGVETIGDIPEHWNIKRLGHLGGLQNGISKSADDFGFGHPFVSYGDVYRNMELPKEVTGLVNSTRSERYIYSVRKCDVFFTRTSETIEEIGLTSTCSETIENATFAGFLIRFRPRSSDLIPNFSKFYFRSENHRSYFVKEMNIVTRASLSQDLLKKLPVLLPPAEEQQEIAEFLEAKCTEVDKLINEIKQFIIQVEKYKNSLVYDAVTGKIDVRNDVEVKM